MYQCFACMSIRVHSVPGSQKKVLDPLGAKDSCESLCE